MLAVKKITISQTTVIVAEIKSVVTPLKYFFFFILFMGFLYAHKKGALKWM